uniref:Protocadherin-16 n=1 Tax=Oncorhynchus tshawytscha TaxID=74940 RepID=A0A8C8IWR7_ONCTS
MKTEAKGLGRSVSRSLQNEGRWSRGVLLLVYIVLELITVHSSTVLGNLELQLDEEQPAGTIVGDISAGLPPGVTANLYFISDHEGTGVGSDLDIDESTGIIKTAKVLDHELRDRYNFIAVTMTGVTVEVTITVNDINDHAPTFPRRRAAFKIPEMTAVGTRFPLEPAVDGDKGQLTTQGYLINDGNPGQAFLLETRRGSNQVLYLDLVVNTLLDSETRPSYTLSLEAFDGGSPKRTGQMVLDVTVQDINDNAPVFNQSRYHAIISENLQPGSNILQVFASDVDQGDNGLVLYEINRRQSDPESYFVIDSRTGVITLNKPLDFEMRRVHELVVQARDNATQPEVTNAFVTIHVRDYNDNQPTMTIIFLSEDGSPQISEGAQPGQYVARISVTDPDYGEYANVNVSLEGGDGKFALTTKDNIIYLMCVDQILDREERDTYELRVMATDAGTPPLRAESSFTIQVTDVNDNPPLFDQQQYRQVIPEVVFPGSFVLQVTARDKDQGPNGDITYSLLQDGKAGQDENQAQWFTIDPVTGIITTLSQLDYESQPRPNVTVVATDRGRPSLSSTALVHVVLQDINDNEPVFGTNFYNVSIKENTAAGTCILEVTATDADGGSFGSISYSLGSGINSAVPSQFSVGKETGQICTNVALDRDQGQTSYDFTVTAVDGGGLNSVAYVRVDLLDINDNRPVFYPVSYAVSLSSQSAPGTSVVKVTALDPDTGENGRVTYRTVPRGDSPFFTLNKDTGVISLSRSLHGKANTVIPMVVSAQDGGGLAALVNARVNISVVAGLVAPPVFEHSQYSFTVSENVLRGTEVGIVQAISKNGGPSKDILYTISSGDPAGYFTVDPESGALRTSLPLDHEAQPSLTLELQARSGSPPAFGQTHVHITIQDINDNAPVFMPSSSESLLLPEHTEIGTVVYRVQAKDRDSGLNGQMTFDLSSTATSIGGQRTFSMERSTGEIRLVGGLSYDVTPRYDLTVTAKDGGAPQLSSTMMLVVHVQAENDHGPVFDTLTYRVELRENTPLSTRFLQVCPVDYAAGFGIAADSGWLFVKSALDREVKDMYMLMVLATSGHGQLKKTGSATVRVSVTDENDNSPRLTQERAFLAVRENLPAGSGFGRVSAMDRDSGLNGRLSYRLLHPDRSFQINSHTGEISTRVGLDREQQSSYQVLLVVQDGGTPPRSATGTAFITVLDENDNTPSFRHSQPGRGLTMQVMEGQASGLLLGKVQAKDPDEGENGTVYYSMSGPRAERFSLNPTTGELRSSSPLSHSDRAEYSFTVSATDRGQPSHSATCTLHIQVRPLTPTNSLSIYLNSVEEAKPGSVIGSVKSHDSLELPEAGQVTYTVVGGSDRDGTFMVDRQTGDVYLARELDYERSARYTLQIEVDDFSMTLPSSHLVQLDIEVKDSNDHAPYFPEDPVTMVIPENMEPGASIYTFQASDQDGSGPNSLLTYSILHQYPDLPDILTLHPSTGVLTLAQELDHEVTSSLILVVQATDSALNGSQRRWGSVTARVFVTDENDNAPVFSSPSAVSVMEDQPVGFVVLYVVARDADQGENRRVSYFIETGNAGGTFSLNPNTGSLSNSSPPPQAPSLTPLLSSTPGSLSNPSPLLHPRILLLPLSSTPGSLSNSSPPPLAPSLTPLLHPRIILLPLSSTPGSLSNSSPPPQAPSLTPLLHPRLPLLPLSSTFPGSLSILKPIDREEQVLFNLTIVAQDYGVPALSSSQLLSVQMLDENDNAPTFSRLYYSLEVPENMEAVELFTLRATDLDTGDSGEMTYKITAGDLSGDFRVDRKSGVLSTSRPLDRERRARYSLTVTALDGGSPALSSTATVEVTLLDVNDHSPQIFKTRIKFFFFFSSVSSHRILATMRAEDRDFGANGSVFYRFASPVRGFTINSLTGDIQGLTQGQRTLIVEAMDQGSPAQSSLGVVVIYIREQTYRGIRFSRHARDVSLQENAAKGTAVVQTQAQYPDGSRSGISYSIFSGNTLLSFGISSSTGEIWVQSSMGLDYEESPRLRLVVKAETASSSSFMAVNLILQDVNDNLPRFQLQNYVAYIREAQGYHFPIIQVVADDLDQGQNGQVTYSLRSSSLSGLFKIDSLTGSITTAAIMDREIWTQTKLVVTATDRGTPRLAGSATLTVIIVDLNDNSPTIPLPREIRVPENTLVGSVITQVTGNDVDSGPALSYTLHLDPSSQGVFGIHRYGGGVSLTAPLDYEEKTWYTLTVRATDSKHQTEANLTILVEDVNDNAPTFTQDLYQMTLAEHSPAGSAVVTVTATDRDSGENGRVTYRVMSSTRDIFYIDPSNGTLFITQQAEFDSENPSILVVIESRDMGTPALSSIATVQVQVTDVNDNAPVFHQSEYRATVSEDGLPGATILTLEATDGDASRDNCGFDFTIASGNAGSAFQIESSVRFLEGRGFQTVGSLVLTGEGLDFEAVSSYNLTVVVSDRGVPQRSSAVSALISVTDTNDNPPAFSRAEFSVVLSEGTAAGTEVLSLSATDPDSSAVGKVQYLISSGDETGMFQVDRWTGALRLQRPLENERQASHVIIVQASDGQGHYALAPVTVEVKDINDNRPYFPLPVLTTSIRENQPHNTLVTMLHAIDQDTGVFGQLRYYMLDKTGEGKDAFLVNQTSGEVRTRFTFDFEKVNLFNFVALAMDAGNFSATVTVQVYVTGEDEYDPVFSDPEFSFLVPEGSKKGQSIGQVTARDEDEGVDGIVLYSLADPSPYFQVNASTGGVFLKMDSHVHHLSRSKREVRVMNLDLKAHSPLETSRVATARLTVDVTHTSFGVASDMNLLLVSVIAVSLGAILILIFIAMALFCVRLRRQRKEQQSRCRPPASPGHGTMLHKLEETKVTSTDRSDRIYHQALPGYTSDQTGSGVVGPYPRGGSLDPSHSSGRGSAEAAEDDEIRMINEYPRVSSISSSMQEHISARGPDSGIQQDADQLSDVSCEPNMDANQWFKAKKLASLSGTLLAGQVPVYREDVGGYLGVGRGLNISHPKDYAFPVDGKPAVDGSLTAIVASDEELRGSYNWDYLLDWCPQFQPLASVFTEIARLKDETAPPNPRRPLQHKAKVDPKPPRIDPPPLITSIAHPGAKTVPVKPAPVKPSVGRSSFPHLASLRRSPISHEGSPSSVAMSPSFSPSLSPLAARSPAITPFGVTQGPSASMISTTEHSMEHSEEAEMRI